MPHVQGNIILETNLKHFNHPEVGDFWHERFCPYFTVVDVLDNDEIIIYRNVDFGGDPVGKRNKPAGYSGYERVKKDYLLFATYSGTLKSGFCADVYVAESLEEFKKKEVYQNYLKVKESGFIWNRVSTSKAINPENQLELFDI